MNYYKQITKTFIVLTSILMTTSCATVQTADNNSILSERKDALQCKNMCGQFGEFVWMHSYNASRANACICKDIEWNLYSAEGGDDGAILMKIEKP